ncbi:AMP-binding protein [Dactylosporangium cerinum]|uniref:AMP-binding protein n=1 Tax=Dactylosporangium cerinum TaxID=1434730 RepID=A0ABV9VSW3_9ACTN
MPRGVWSEFEERFGSRILEWYGTTEGVAFAYKPVGQGPVGSFGKPPAGVIEMDVVDDEGHSVPPGVPGELIARSSGVDAQLTYIGQPEASAEKVRGGWLHTGDMVTRDDDGWLFYAHRKEQGAIRKLGEFIADGYITRVLAAEPTVADVFVYGIPSDTGAPGESDIVAAVLPVPGADCDPQALIALVAAQLERSHVPDVVQLVRALPTTSAGKIERQVLMKLLDRPDATVIDTYDRRRGANP